MSAVALAVLAAVVGSTSSRLPFRGTDLSFIPQVEAAGGIYRDKGKVEDPFVIYRRHGIDLARIRIWVDPKDGWCDLPHTLSLAKRAKSAGMKILLNFHYSDTWADPGHQIKPESWRTLQGQPLVDKVRSYSRDVEAALVAQGTAPDIVQVGNEVRAGMIWPDARLSSDDANQWKTFVALFEAGRAGVLAGAGAKKPQIMLHLDQGGDWRSTSYFLDRATGLGAKFDLIGLSYYPWWHGSLDQLRDNLERTAKTYHKGIFVVETSYPFTLDPMKGRWHMVSTDKGLLADYPPTIEGQAAYLRRLADIVRAVPEGLGKGIVYWVADWLYVPGGEPTWENMNLFDGNGNALPGLDALGKG